MAPIKCGVCREISSPFDLVEHFMYSDLMICPECYEYELEADAAEMDSIARAEQYNEEVLAGMHHPGNFYDEEEERRFW